MSLPPTQRRTKPVFKIAAIDDQEKFRPLPKPTGPYPYHLNLSDVLTDALNDSAFEVVGDNTNKGGGHDNGDNKNPSGAVGAQTNKMTFQICGDTGGIVLPTFQHHIVREMAQQITQAPSAEERPQFFFHLGDVVYNFGQAEGYEQQFFTPFSIYPAPIFAIAGNHDSDVDPLNPKKPHSLDAFMRVFCDTESRPIPFAGNNIRKSNIQPNVYFTLKTPLANFICLYGNVPRFGTITAEQREWFINELKTTGTETDKALILCLHNATYSADTNHGSSLNMQVFLNNAFEEAKVIPDIVFSGHVHNYQRLSKQYANGKRVPFIIAGAGGYAQLHQIAALNDPDFPDTSPQFNGVQLENYCDHAHGFMKVTIEKSGDKLTLGGEYYIINDDDANSPAVLFDEFKVNLD